MQTDPAHTQMRDSMAVGHRPRNHNAANPQQHTATATAMI